MKSVGEVMAIGRTIHESLQKALRGLETGLTGFDVRSKRWHLRRSDERDRIGIERWQVRTGWLSRLMRLRCGFSVERINAITHYEPWFLNRIAEVIAAEAEVRRVEPALFYESHPGERQDPSRHLSTGGGMGPRQSSG